MKALEMSAFKTAQHREGGATSLVLIPIPAEWNGTIHNDSADPRPQVDPDQGLKTRTLSGARAGS